MWVRVGKGVNEENNWLVMCTTEEIRSDISSDISCVLDWVFCISHYTPGMQSNLYMSIHP